MKIILFLITALNSLSAYAHVSMGAFLIYEISENGTKLLKAEIRCNDPATRRNYCDRQIIRIDGHLRIEVQNYKSEKGQSWYCKISEKSESSEESVLFFKDFTNEKNISNFSNGKYGCEHFWHVPI